MGNIKPFFSLHTLGLAAPNLHTLDLRSISGLRPNSLIYPSGRITDATRVLSELKLPSSTPLLIGGVALLAHSSSPLSGGNTKPSILARSHAYSGARDVLGRTLLWHEKYSGARKRRMLVAPASHPHGHFRLTPGSRPPGGALIAEPVGGASAKRSFCSRRRPHHRRSFCSCQKWECRQSWRESG